MCCLHSRAGAVIIDFGLATDFEELQEDLCAWCAGFDGTVGWSGSQHKCIEFETRLRSEDLSEVAIALKISLALPCQFGGSNIADACASARIGSGRMDGRSIYARGIGLSQGGHPKTGLDG